MNPQPSTMPAGSRRPRFGIHLVLATLAIAASGVDGAPAATIVVTSRADVVKPGNDECTLREAIANANDDTDVTDQDCAKGGGFDTIEIPAGSYLLGGTELELLDDVELRGAEGGGTVIDGGQASRVIRVTWVADYPGPPAVVLRDLTITGGRASGDGGGISNHLGHVELIDSTVRDCEAEGGDGGGIYNYFGTLSLSSSTIAENWATSSLDDDPVGGDGGGIYNYLGTLSLSSSTIAENWATSSLDDDPVGGDGGGIFSIGPVELVDSTVRDCRARYGDGGGIHYETYGHPHRLRIESSTISDNVAFGAEDGTGGAGGGIYARGDDLSIVELLLSTLSWNSAHGGLGGASRGGGIASYGNVTIDIGISTVSGNSADVGAGIQHRGPGARLHFQHSTFSSNALALGYGEASVEATHNALSFSPCTEDPFTSGGYNVEDASLSSGVACGFAPTDTSVWDLALAPLGDYGGPTPTHALLSYPVESPAIDFGSHQGCPPFDQRGEHRPVDGNDDFVVTCDAGAFELHEPLTVKVSSFEALPGNRRVDVSWTTAYEVGNSGFHLYRGPSADGPWTLLNPDIIAGEEYSFSTRDYTWRDSPVEPGIYWYQLQNEGFHGTSSHDPVQVEVRAGCSTTGGTGSPTSFLPVLAGLACRRRRGVPARSRAARLEKGRFAPLWCDSIKRGFPSWKAHRAVLRS